MDLLNIKRLPDHRAPSAHFTNTARSRRAVCIRTTGASTAASGFFLFRRGLFWRLRRFFLRGLPGLQLLPVQPFDNLLLPGQ